MLNFPRKETAVLFKFHRRQKTCILLVYECFESKKVGKFIMKKFDKFL